MKTIVAGSRSFKDYGKFKLIMDHHKNFITTIISGHASGVDQMGERYARENNIHLEIFPADWESYGKKAGYLRNIQMAEHADFLIAFWDGESKGTKHMIDIANKRNIGTDIYYTYEINFKWQEI